MKRLTTALCLALWSFGTYSVLGATIDPNNDSNDENEAAFIASIAYVEADAET